MKFVRSSCVFALAAAACMAQTGTPVDVTRTTGMIGLGDAQVARFNLLNTGAIAPSTAIGCAATVSFYDAANVQLKTATLSIAPGMSASLDLASAALPVAAGDRREIRATFTVLATPSTTPNTAATPVCTLVPTLEIFDAVTGRTLVTLGRTRQVP